MEDTSFPRAVDLAATDTIGDSDLNKPSIDDISISDLPTPNDASMDIGDTSSTTFGVENQSDDVSLEGIVDETEQKRIISDNDVFISTTGTSGGETETMFRRSPEGSPASPRTTSPVTKRVHFQDTIEDEDGLPISHKDDDGEASPSKDYRKADTHWYDKDNRLKPRPIPKSVLKESEDIFMLQETYPQESKAEVEFTTILDRDSPSVVGNEDETSYKPNSQSEKRSETFPPAPFVKGSLRRQSACHWGCCCTFGWFMVGAVALSAGAVLVAYLKGYWLAEDNSFERSLLYFGAALCAIGGLSLITGLAFFVCVTLVWQPGGSSDGDSKQVDLTRSKYVVNNKSSIVEIEPISIVGNGHVTQQSDVTIMDSSTSYVPERPSFPVHSDYPDDTT